MSPWWRRVERWRLFALLLWGLPVVTLMPLGVLWLRETGMLWIWLGGLVACATLGWLLLWWAQRRERAWFDTDAGTRPDPGWSPRAEALWEPVERLAAEVRLQDWPLERPEQLAELGRLTLDTVARRVHPELDEPLLELTLPHTLLIIERAARDLRQTLLRELPFSHRLRLGALMRLYRWKPFAERMLGLYRVGRLVLNPTQALLAELHTALQGNSVSRVRDEFQTWLLREYVRKVGYYAIALYAEPTSADGEDPEARATSRSARDLEQAAQSVPEQGEPLRILILGRANAGKSSLVNALFGELRTGADPVADTTEVVQPLHLEREGLELALVFDTPGLESLSETQVLELGAEADLLLWVSPAHRPDRQLERQRLDALRARFAARTQRRAPPLLVVLSHIDRLRPPREWSPPYDLNAAETSKAANMRAALLAMSEDLAIDPDQVIPVCLADERVYNVEDMLWAAIMAHLDAARRTRLLRCRTSRVREQDWALLWRQLGQAGRRVLALPGRGRDSRETR